MTSRKRLYWQSSASARRRPRLRIGNAALHWVAAQDKTIELRFLLDNKADVNAPNQNGEVPLHLAFGNGHMEIIRLLLQADPPAKRDVRDNVGFIPVHYATIELAERMGSAGW